MVKLLKMLCWLLEFVKNGIGGQVERVIQKVPQKQDIDLLVATGELDYFILTRGMDFKLSISGSILEYVMLKVPNVIICGSEDVMDHYNDLVAKGERVAALIHSTC